MGDFFQGLETVKRDDGEATYPGARPPPPGVTPNLEDPVDAGHDALFIGYTICIVICTLLFFLRTAVKCCIVRHSFLEDGQSYRRQYECPGSQLLMIMASYLYHCVGAHHALCSYSLLQ